MVAITRTSMINSNNTQINSDYDFSMLRKKILGWESGILKAGDFFLDKNNRRLSAVSPIAEAVILCTRTTSYPIGNQTFYAHFQFTGTIENISIDEGTKIFIEIKENLILDPSLISDSDGRSDYAKWFWIGEIKIAKSYPSHSNYLPLREIQGGQPVDKRKVISIPALDAVSQRTTTLESKVQQTEGKIEKLEERWAVDHLDEIGLLWEKVWNFKETYIILENKITNPIKFVKKDITDIKNYDSSSKWEFVFYDESGSVIPHTEIVAPWYGFYPDSAVNWWDSFIKEFKSLKRISKIVFKHIYNWYLAKVPQFFVSADNVNWVKFNVDWWTPYPQSLSENVIFGSHYAIKNYDEEEKKTRLLRTPLFKQYVPTIENSIIPINIGDIDRNKEIHIQRLWSWIKNNQLKLKLKKIWSPTTSVIVEVRKWVMVDVNDDEAYRYGGEVIASTTIAYTEFTMEWKEFTLTLNNQFWGNNGELLDIVVYQQWGMVNWSNYYQMACDITQHSEALSYVSVNWTSRIRERLIPYCNWVGFEGSVICKNQSTVKLSSSSMNCILIWKDRDINPWARNTATIYEYIAPADFDSISFAISTRRKDYNYSSTLYVQRWSEKYNYWWEQTASDLTNETKTFSKVKKWEKITWFLYWEGYWWSAYITSLSITEGQWISIYNSQYRIFPRHTANIWDKITLTLHWKHIDDQFIWWKIDTVLSNSATTGSIAPANAVGYMSIIGADWKKYKIRVYGE